MSSETFDLHPQKHVCIVQIYLLLNFKSPPFASFREIAVDKVCGIEILRIENLEIRTRTMIFGYFVVCVYYQTTKNYQKKGVKSFGNLRIECMRKLVFTVIFTVLGEKTVKTKPSLS